MRFGYFFGFEDSCFTLQQGPASSLSEEMEVGEKARTHVLISSENYRPHSTNSEKTTGETSVLSRVNVEFNSLNPID